MFVFSYNNLPQISEKLCLKCHCVLTLTLVTQCQRHSWFTRYSCFLKNPYKESLMFSIKEDLADKVTAKENTRKNNNQNIHVLKPQSWHFLNNIMWKWRIQQKYLQFIETLTHQHHLVWWLFIFRNSTEETVTVSNYS